jgi:hypothetical protein
VIGTAPGPRSGGASPQFCPGPANHRDETGLSARSDALEAGFHVVMADRGAQVAVRVVLVVPESGSWDSVPANRLSGIGF